MTLAELIDEAALCAKEREDHATNLERAIGLGHVKRQPSDVAMMRRRFPAMRAGLRALELIAAWGGRLPAEFIAEVEREP
jgi:hypothetical protein